MLTQDQLKEVLHYCPETGVFTWLKPQCLGHRAGTNHVTHSGKTYRRLRLSGRWYKEHKLAFLYMTGSFPFDQVDHENGNGTDNRWTNLRDISVTENNQNKKMPITNTSGTVGVSWDRTKNRWYAYISVKDTNKSIGRFTSKDDAIAARKAAEVELGYHPNHGSNRPL